MKKFLFDNDFGLPAEPPPSRESLPKEVEIAEPEADPIEPEIPQIDEAEIERARQAAYAEGEAAGRQAERSDMEAQSLAVLSTCEAKLSRLLEQQEREAESVSSDAVAIARAAIKKLFPNFAERGALDEVEALIATCMGRLKGEPRIVIRLCDEMLDTVKERLGKIAQKNGFQGKVVLLAEEELGPGDVLIEWADGGAERDSGRLLADIDQILSAACPQALQEDHAPPVAGPKTAAADEAASHV